MQYTGEKKIELPHDAFVRLELTTQVPVQIFGHDDTGEFPLGVINPRRGPQRLRQRYFGVEAITLRPTPAKASYALSYAVSEGNRYEPLDDRPLPELKQATNLLARMRQEFRQQLGVTREHFLNDTGIPGYEIDDDDPGLFEEEITATAKEASGRKGTSQQQPEGSFSSSQQKSSEPSHNPKSEVQTDPNVSSPADKA